MDPVISEFKPGAIGSTPTNRSKTIGDEVMGKDEFLKLLVTQLSNQDPMNPMDGQQFAAQLAQFTSVEQLMNISGALAENGEMNALLAQSVNSGVAAGLIGKTIESAGNNIDFDGENPVKLKFKLDEDAVSLTITIRDSAGNPVREVHVDGRSKGDQEYEWAGDDTLGNKAQIGTYTYDVTAVDKDGNTVGSHAYFRGQVDRVSFGKDGIMLWIGNARVPMSDVESVE